MLPWNVTLFDVYNRAITTLHEDVDTSINYKHVEALFVIASDTNAYTKLNKCVPNTSTEYKQMTS